MEGSRVINNLGVDRLREKDAATEGEKKQRDARAAKGAQVEQTVVVGWAGEMVQLSVTRRPLRRYVHNADPP